MERGYRLNIAITTVILLITAIGSCSSTALLEPAEVTSIDDSYRYPYANLTVEWTGRAPSFTIYLHDVFNGSWEKVGSTSNLSYNVENLTYRSIYGIIVESDYGTGSVNSTGYYLETCGGGINYDSVEVDDTSVNVSWSTTDTQHGQYITWVNRWYPHSDLDCSGFVRGDSQSVIIDGLKPGSGYHVNTYVLYPIPHQSYGYSFTTLETASASTTAAPGAQPTGLVTSFNWRTTGLSQLFVEWTGTANAYSLYFNGPDGIIETFRTTGTNYTTSNLVPGTFYDVTIEATDASNVRSNQTFCLNSGASSASTLHVTDQQVDYIAVEWDPAPGSRGYYVTAYGYSSLLHHYYGCCHITCPRGYRPVSASYAPPQATSAVLENLHPDTEYEIQLWILYETGAQASSASISTTASYNAPPATNIGPPIQLTAQTPIEPAAEIDYLQSLTRESEISESQLNDVVQSVEALTTYFRETPDNDQDSSAEQKQSILQSISLLARKINFGSNNSSPAGNRTFTAVTENLVLQVQDRATDFLKEANIVEFAPSIEGVEGSPVIIRVPTQEITQRTEQGGKDSVRAVFLLHRDSTLFPSDRQAEWVISAEFGDDETAYEDLNFSEPVTIEYPPLQQEEEPVGNSEVLKKNISEMECVFWDFKLFSWSRRGCCLVPGDPPTCQCDHLTNFAVLVAIRSVPIDFRLSLSASIGCALSIFGLVATFVVICSVRRIRRLKQMQVILHLCFNLAVTYAIFLAGIYQTHDRSLCSGIAVTLHYFLLASFAWMAIYGHILYRSAVEVLESVGHLYKIKRAALFGYGLPAVVVALNAGITLGHFDQEKPTLMCEGGNDYTPSDYNFYHVCWLRDYSLYLGFLLPVGLLLISNLFVFMAVLPRITCMRAKIQSTAQRRTARHHLEVAVVLVTMMGLSWVVGYIMMISDNETHLIMFSWIFTVINSVQGFCIFLVLVVRKGEVRKGFNDMLKQNMGTWCCFDTRGVAPTEFSDIGPPKIPRAPTIKTVAYHPPSESSEECQTYL